MTFYNFLDLLVFVSPLLLILGIVAGSYYFKKLDPTHRILLFYLLACLLIDLACRVYGKMFGNNLIFISVFGFLELVLFSVLYLHFLKGNKFLWMLVVPALGFIVVEGVSINVYNLADFQIYSRVIASFLITIMSIAYYFEKINNEVVVSQNMLFLNSSVLVFYALNLICFLPINFLINEHSDIKFYFWFANLVITLVFYGLIIFSIWRHGRSRRQLHYG